MSYLRKRTFYWIVNGFLFAWGVLFVFGIICFLVDAFT